jgi:hypothetical protein
MRRAVAARSRALPAVERVSDEAAVRRAARDGREETRLPLGEERVRLTERDARLHGHRAEALVEVHDAVEAAEVEERSAGAHGHARAETPAEPAADGMDRRAVDVRGAHAGLHLGEGARPHDRGDTLARREGGGLGVRERVCVHEDVLGTHDGAPGVEDARHPSPTWAP